MSGRAHRSRTFFLQCRHLLPQSELLDHKIGAPPTYRSQSTGAERDEENKDTEHDGGILHSLARISSGIQVLDSLGGPVLTRDGSACFSGAVFQTLQNFLNHPILGDEREDTHRRETSGEIESWFDLGLARLRRGSSLAAVVGVVGVVAVFVSVLSMAEGFKYSGSRSEADWNTSRRNREQPKTSLGTVPGKSSAVPPYLISHFLENIRKAEYADDLVVPADQQRL